VNSLSDGVIVHAADRFIGCATSACHPPLRARLCRRRRSTALPPSVPGGWGNCYSAWGTGYSALEAVETALVATPAIAPAVTSVAVVNP